MSSPPAPCNAPTRSAMTSRSSYHCCRSAVWSRSSNQCSTAVSTPMMSSFDTFIGRPRAWCGEALDQAAAVDHEIGAAHEPRARPLEMLGGGVDHDRDAARFDDRGDLLDPQAAEMLLLAEQHDHRHRLGKRPVEVVARLDFDE